MKKILAIFLITLAAQAYSQTELGKMSVEGTPYIDKTAITKRRLPDGRFCAGLQILSDLEGFSYDSYLSVVGLDDMPGRDILFLDPEERVVLVYHVGYEPLKIILSEIGIKLKEKWLWEIKISGGVVNMLPVSFFIRPEGAKIEVDGKNLGEGPTFTLKTGEHRIKITKVNCYAVQDTIKVDPSHALFTYYLAYKPEMVFIKGSTFRMGSKDGQEEEKPVHKVILNDFYIGKYEVIFEEYYAFCEATGRKKPGDAGWGREKRPAIFVSWYEAVEFCNWLSKQEELTPCYKIDKTRKDPNNKSGFDDIKWLVACNFSANGYRLPTEAEWEYAARGGRQSAQYKYAGSNNAAKVGWYYDNSGYKTHPVGEKKPNELDICDMSGNIEEWCWDWYNRGYYSSSPASNPQGPESGSSRVKRGGYWLSYTVWYVRCSIRNGCRANRRNNEIGFRLCRTK